MSDLKVGDSVEVKESKGRGSWQWLGRRGKITRIDKYCYTVALNNGPTVRDQRDHFRPA
jgi:hypothetical protein